jgi:hypothetical protein
MYRATRQESKVLKIRRLQLPHRFPFLCCITNLGKKRKIYDRLISIVATARLHLRPHDKGDFFSGVAGNFELLAFVPAKAFEIDMAPLRTLPWVS